MAARRGRFWALVGASLVIAGCTENAYQPPPPPTVTVAVPVREAITRSLNFTGTTVPIEQVEIRARVQGFLESIEYEPGAEVEAGATLFRIDAKPFEARLAQAAASRELAKARGLSGQAQLASAEAVARNADIQLRRSTSAAASGAVTQSQLDELKADLDTANAAIASAQALIASAEAEAAAAQAAYDEAELDLGYTTVTSPIAGRVGRNLVDVGSLVGAQNATHLATVVKYDPMYVEYNISEADLLFWLELRRRGIVESNPSGTATDRAIYIGLANETGYPHQGHFEYADLSLDQSTGTFLVRGEFPNPEREIPAGAFVRVHVPIEQVTATLIDERAVSRDQAGSYVLVVLEDNTVERKNITIGDLVDGRREVREGLELTDRVIVNGLLLARAGAKVNPQVAQAPAAKAEAAAP